MITSVDYLNKAMVGKQERKIKEKEVLLWTLVPPSPKRRCNIETGSETPFPLHAVKVIWASIETLTIEEFGSCIH